jgi:hypothetical protein
MKSISSHTSFLQQNLLIALRSASCGIRKKTRESPPSEKEPVTRKRASNKKRRRLPLGYKALRYELARRYALGPEAAGRSMCPKRPAKK